MPKKCAAPNCLRKAGEGYRYCPHHGLGHGVKALKSPHSIVDHAVFDQERGQAAK